METLIIRASETVFTDKQFRGHRKLAKTQLNSRNMSIQTPSSCVSFNVTKISSSTRFLDYFNLLSAHDVISRHVDAVMAYPGLLITSCCSSGLT